VLRQTISAPEELGTDCFSITPFLFITVCPCRTFASDERSILFPHGTSWNVACLKPKKPR